MPIGAAIGVGSAVAGGANIIAGNKASKAAQKAADQQVAEQRRQYDLTRADFAPWRQTGQNALDILSRTYGLNGQAPDNSAFFTSPGYEFRRDEGLRAIDRANSARGLLTSGAADKARMRYADGLASSEYSDWWNRLAGLSGTGQTATQSTAAAGQNMANAVSSAYQQAGNARASAYLNTGAQVGGVVNNALSAYLRQSGWGNPYGAGY